MNQEPTSKMTLYHATSLQVLKQMMKDGAILPPEETGLTSNGLGFDKSGEQGGIYLADSEEGVSIYYDEAVERTMFDKNMPNSGVLLEIEVDTNKLTADLDDYEGNGYADSSVSWKDSLEDTGQVVHMGRIDMSQIKAVSFKSKVKSGGYVEDAAAAAGKSPVRYNMEIRKQLHLGKGMPISEAEDVIANMEASVRDEFESNYQNKVMYEQTYCKENNMERLRLVREHDIGENSHGEHRFLLAVTRLNDLDISINGIEHHANPMLYDKGGESTSQYYATYTKAERDAIVEHMSKTCVFLAKMENLPGSLSSKGKAIVDSSTVKPSLIAFNLGKHIENTEQVREERNKERASQQSIEIDEGITV